MTLEQPSGPAPADFQTDLRPSGERSAADLPRLTNETLRLWKAFAPLAPEQRRWALAAGVVETVRPGDVHRGAGEVAVVVSGCLATEATGSDLTAELLGPGDVAATGTERPVAGQWVTEGEIYRVALPDWLERAGAAGMQHLLNAEDRRRVRLERRLVCASRHLASARVADLLLSIHQAAPGRDILLSQERIGRMLGVRRSTVNGSCRALERSGGARTGRGKIRILDGLGLSTAACDCHAAR